ncbi:MAG: cytochrome c oxidase accessory protein CcoG, partial [Magnetospirillum sp.]|nr:cytochrome c oxidase accessory protein CcoG [Magnetospirillum sp.]
MNKATSNVTPSNKLYAETVTIHPRKVKGPFRTIKWWLMAALLAFWHLAPFIRWDRGPGAASQAILADMTGRRGYFFFI